MIDATCRAEDELMERLAAGEHQPSAFSSPVGDQRQRVAGEGGPA
jgi:hypothetical protein